MLTRLLGIVIVLFACTLAKADEPCGRDGCPLKVQLVQTGPLHQPGYAPMPVGDGPAVAYAHPMIAAVRLTHPLRTFAHHHPIRTFIHNHRRH